MVSASSYTFNFLYNLGFIQRQKGKGLHSGKIPKYLTTIIQSIPYFLFLS